FLWADRLEEWRVTLTQLYEQAVEQGDESSIPILLGQLSYTKKLQGDSVAAKHLMDEYLESSQPIEQNALALFWKASLDAHLGLVAAAREGAERAVAIAEGSGENWVRIQSLGTLGFLELSLGNPVAAHEQLARAVAGADAAGLREPSECMFVPDDV